jgi:hypothetical protein
MCGGANVHVIAGKEAIDNRDSRLIIESIPLSDNTSPKKQRFRLP